ncbi:MAG TPA: undecaprenyldiphospho-muramoylpentapeptide beta-N-acetylglucosaminyltransferase [Burkholderiales bacterium]|nr:undecaprenyldiphospho-muramoylpentapeptide beta-N-acetylglucosaminyltransferase [Burkholderiales bacterium]
MSRTILIMAGGTGGHIFPALAVAEYLRAQDWKVVWMGNRAGMEAGLIPQRGFAMAWVRFSGVRGRNLLQAALLPLQLLIAFWQSSRAIFFHRPHVVLGMGGYVSFPGAMMAALFNRPLAIHEQNSVAGLANRVLAKLADRVLTTFPEAFGEATAVLITGNPVRSEISSMAPPENRYRARGGRLRVLVMGGSQGARVLNTTVPDALALVPEDTRPRVLHQAGAAHLEFVRRRYEERGVAAEVADFIGDIASRYAEADLIICRAGATTVAEIAAAGIASLLVPYPYAVDDHQMVNARFLADRGAALLMPQSEFTPQRLAEVLTGSTRDRLLAMAQRARAVGKPDATLAVAKICMELAG